MRNNLKRTVAALLVLVMVLAMLPTFAFAAEGDPTFSASPLDGIPADNQAVVIYSASAPGVFANGASGSIGVAEAKTTEESSDISVGTGAGVYKLQKNSDGTYYIMSGGKYLWVDSAESLEMKDTAETGTKWKITPATGGFSGYTISNAEVKFNNKYDIYIEFYGSFKAWTMKEMSEIFTFTFYSIDETAADPDGDGYIGKKPVAGEKPADGDKVAIFNEYGGVCFSFQSDDALAPSMTGAVSSLNEDGTLNAGNGSLIFEVGFDGTYYTFKNGGKYLRTSPNETGENGKINNAECLYMDTLYSDYSYWTLKEMTGGYMMVNKTAKYGSNSVSIEFFSNSFSGWTYNGSANLFAMRFFKVEDKLGLGYVLNPKVDIAANDAFIGVDYGFSFVLDELTKVTSLSVQYSVGGEYQSITPTETKAYHYDATVPASALAGKTKLTLKIDATNEYGMSYSATKEIEVKDEPLIVSVSPLPNAATKTEKRPEISAEIANCGSNPTVVMTLDGAAVTPTVTNTKVSYKAAENMADGRHVIDLKITRGDGKEAEMTWSFFVGEAGMSLYFGQIHSHTAQYSDGAGTLADAYEHAMEADDVDFLIVTDHSNYFDTTKTATTTSYYDLTSLTKGDSLSKWEEARATAAQYNAMRDDFVAAYGYEMTWSGGPGHTNTYNTYGTVSRNNGALNEKTNSYAGMHLYNDLMVNANNGVAVKYDEKTKTLVQDTSVTEFKTKYIEDAPVVSQFNHPGTTFGTFDDYAGYTPVRDAILNLIEVGNGEGAVGGSSYWPSYSEYDKCLAKGWHVAPTNNQDNHKGKWGDANTCRDVVVTDDFTEAGLYRAFAERRVYSTEDQNLRIYYNLNDQIMGSIVDVGMEEPKEVTISLSVSDPDGEKLGKIEIIGENGKVLKTYTAAGSTFELNEAIPHTDAYYYVKVTQADGDIAVTAPVWMGEATPITCDIKTDAALSVTGESEKISSTLTNGTEKSYLLNKVRFTLTDANGKQTTIKTFVEDVEIPAGANKVYSFDYVREIAGDQTITVTYYGTYEGKNFKVQQSMKHKVRSAEGLTRIAVDSGHDNYYVSGDYSGSMSNFISFAASNGALVRYIGEGQFTYDNLKDYKLLILTVNYVRNTRKAKDYTADEIAALKKYVENGGNVIICSKSDRDNTFDNCANNSNLLLEAIGAHTRVVNGIIVDNDMKASEAYRVYFSGKENFNMKHRFLKAAYIASNAYGTTPAPDNQTGFQMYNGAPLQVTDDKKVEVLVRGYQTTWGSHYDGYFDSGAFVPEYDPSNATSTTVEKDNVAIMTYEDLPGGGWVVTSGVTFMSNYDIKDDQAYINKFIVQNILLEMNEEYANAKITPISTVKKVPESRSGEQYTIEGYVTSNASAYDQDTAFFDCIYVQDKQGNGINVFPVAGNYAIGMNVRCHGAVTYYCGEVELNLSSDYDGYCRVISDDTYIIKPKTVSCKTAMADSSIGNLMKIGGLVTSIHKTEGVIDKIYVKDTTGEACLFINGYIMKTYTGLDNLRVGMTVTGVGIGSRDVDETSATSAIFPRLRVRNRSEIKIVSEIPDVAAVFDDVKSTDWFADAVKYTVEKGLLNGTASDTFEPSSSLTRAMVATVLYRLAGKPTATAKSSFKDLEEGKWYTDAVNWAASVGVVNGYKDGTFCPNKNISRQEMTAMLARYAKNVSKMDTTAKGNLDKYTDRGDVQAWALNDIVWAVDNGIINGYDGKLWPNDQATRAEFATIVMRFDMLVK